MSTPVRASIKAFHKEVVDRDIRHSEGTPAYVTTEDLQAATLSIQKEIAAMRTTNQEVIISEFSKVMTGLKDSIKEMFATKEDMIQLKKEVSEIKKSNETWMKEQLVKIDTAINAAKTATDKYCADGLDALQDKTKEQVAKLSAEEIKDAKGKIAEFAQRTTEYSISIVENNEKCEALLQQLKKYETKYGNICKEVEANRSSHDEYQKRVSKMETDMIAMQAAMTAFTKQAEENLKVVGKIGELSKSVTDNRTDMDLTVAECKKQCAETIEQLNATKEQVTSKANQIGREYQTVETYIKRVLDGEGDKTVLFERVKRLESQMVAAEQCVKTLRTNCAGTAEFVDGQFVSVKESMEDICELKLKMDNTEKELATLTSLINEQRSQIGPTQRADENRIVQLIKKHAGGKTDPNPKSLNEAIQKQVDLALNKTSASTAPSSSNEGMTDE